MSLRTIGKSSKERITEERIQLPAYGNFLKMQISLGQRTTTYFIDFSKIIFKSNNFDQSPICK